MEKWCLLHEGLPPPLSWPIMKEDGCHSLTSPSWSQAPTQVCLWAWSRKQTYPWYPDPLHGHLAYRHGDSRMFRWNKTSIFLGLKKSRYPSLETDHQDLRDTSGRRESVPQLERGGVRTKSILPTKLIELDGPGAWLYHLLAVWLCTSHLIFLCFALFICQATTENQLLT